MERINAFSPYDVEAIEVPRKFGDPLTREYIQDAYGFELVFGVPTEESATMQVRDEFERQTELYGEQRVAKSSYMTGAGEVRFGIFVRDIPIPSAAKQ